MDEELQKLLDEARSMGANAAQLDDILNSYNSKKKSTNETASKNGSGLGGFASQVGTKSTSPSSLNSQSQSSGNEFTFNPYGVNDVTTQSGVKIPIDKSKIPAPYDKDAYVNNVQKDINAGKLSPIDHNIIATSSTKNPQAVSAYLQGDNKTGEAVDRVDYINKNKQDLTGIIQDYNSQTGEKIIPDALLADPDKLSSWAENYQKQLNSTIKDNTVSGMVYAPGGNQDWLVEADKKRNETRAILNNFLENKKPLLDNHIIQSVAETDLPRNEKIKRIAQLTNPSTYANTQKVLDNTGSVSIDNPLQMVGSLIDEIKGSKKQDDEMLNSQVGYADLALNDAYKKIANDKAAVAHLSGDAGLMQDAKNTYAQIDESVIKKYPAVLKSQMADEIAKQISTESGQLNGSDDEPVSRLGVAAKYNGITSDMVKTFVQRNGWDKDPDRKDAADWLIEHPENIKDASIFGGIVPAAVKPFADLGLGLLDVSGVRTKRDILVSKEGDQLFPTEFNPDETKANFTFLGTDIHARSTANSIAGLAGMTALGITTSGIGRAVGFGLDAAETAELASEGIDVARKAELLGKVGSASEHAAGYASFAIPSVDQNLKASYDNPNITNDAERAVFVTLGAVLNGEGGRLLNLGSIGQVPGLEEDFVKLAKGLSEKTITEDAAKELLNNSSKKYIDYVTKYGKFAGVARVGQKVIEEAPKLGETALNVGTNTLRGAATMAYFTATNKVLNIAFKHPNAKIEDLLPETGQAFIDGLFTMIPFGFVQAVGSPEKNPNSSFKGQLYNMSIFPDATEDIFKLGKKSDEDFNYKKQVLNTAVLHKNVLDATEAESGNKFTTAQKSAYVGNKTVESFLREKADRIIATDNRSQAKKAELIGQANELSQQSADALDGLQYTKTLEPLYDLYHAEKDYDKAFSNFQADKSKENQKAVEETRNVYDNLQNKYFNDKYGVVGAISNTKESDPETFTIDNNPATKSQVEDILNGGQKEADKFDIQYTGNDNAIHKQIQEVGGITENNVTTSPKSRETVLNEGVSDLYSRLEDKAPAHYLDPLDKQKSIEGLTNQVLENPNDIKNDVGKKLAIELISRNSTEDISKSIDKWQTIADKTGENVDEKEKKEANRHIELLNAGLEEKAKIHEAAKPEPIQQPSTVSSEVGEYNGIFSTEISSTSNKGRGTKELLKPTENRQVVMMSPDEYLTLVRKGVNENIISILKSHTNVDDGLVKKHEQKITDKADENINEGSKSTIKDAINKGDKLDMPFVFFDKNGKMLDQDGRNRAAYAKEIGEKQIPVLIENNPLEKSENKPIQSEEAKRENDIGKIPPIETNSIAEGTNENETGITHAQTAEIRKETGLPEYEKNVRTDEELNSMADKEIKDGYNIEGLLRKMEKGILPSDVEQTIMKKHIASLEVKVNKDPSNENLAELKRAVDLSDKVGGSEVARSLRSRQGSVLRDDSLAGFFIKEMEATGVGELTEKQKNIVEKEYKDISEAEEKLNDKISQLEEENATLKANKEIKKQTPTSGKTKKVHEDFVTERKKITESISDKLKKIRGESNVTIIPYANELFAIAPDVAKLVKSYVEEGITKLEDIVKKVHSELKETIPNITDKDIHDLISGEYNEKKQTKSELTRKLEDLKIESRLINKLDALKKGEQPKTERQKIERNREIENLRQQIKDFEQQKRDAVAEIENAKIDEERLIKAFEKEQNKITKDRLGAEVERQKQLVKDLEKKTPEEIALQSYKTRTSNEIQKVAEQLRTNNFEKEKKKESLKLDKEAISLKDNLLKLKEDREIRLMKEEYGKRNIGDKAVRLGGEILNIGRVVKSSFDVSMPFRQGLWGLSKELFTLPIGNNSGFREQKQLVSQFAKMYQSLGSETVHRRIMAEIHDNPRFDNAQKAGLHISDPTSKLAESREELYGPSLAERIPIIGKSISIGDGKKVGGFIKSSERAATTFVNTMKWDIYNNFVDLFEKQGKTFESSPESYEAAATYANQAVGRGKLGDKLEKANAITSKLFFSLRLQASRLQLMSNLVNPRFYAKVPKEVRIAYLQDMAKFVALGLTTLGIASSAGLNVGVNPFASNFGKIRAGDTEYDIWGGFSQWAVLFARLIAGKTTDKGGHVKDLGSGYKETSRLDVLSRFGRSKLSPEAGVAVNLLSGKDYLGQKTDVKTEAINFVNPLLLQDAKQAFESESVKQAVLTTILAAHGISVATYKH